MIKTVFWGFVLFIAISFFGISLKAIIESPMGQENLAYLVHLATSFWHWLTLYVQYLWFRLTSMV